jgi:hypothetical protein
VSLAPVTPSLCHQLALQHFTSDIPLEERSAEQVTAQFNATFVVP